MAFQQALSGLNSAAKSLDVTSNNIANASTVGFKQSTTHFADVYANSLSGGGTGTQVGIGVSVAGIQQQYTQGNLTTTNNPLDIAINGQGFFRMDQNGSVSYTRSGQFHMDKDGYIVNDQSMKLTGYLADVTGQIVASAPGALQVSSADLTPVATGASVGGSFQGVIANMNLDSRSVPPTTAWVDGPASGGGQWTPNASTYNYSTALSVYDTLGNAHTMSMYFVKEAASGLWSVYGNVDGTTNMELGGGPIGTLQFDTSGQLTGATSMTTTIDLNGVATDLGSTNNAASPLTFDIEFDTSTQFGSSFGTNRLQQDGYTSGHLTGLSIGADGIIQGRYSNGQTLNQGQVVLANFTNPNGLNSMGNNQWAETSTSGTPLVGAPDTASLGVLQSASIEESNVDLTAELVNMITQQRNYQASAQAIKTQDQIMQTLVNLR